jgi:hypothetical protein
MLTLKRALTLTLTLAGCGAAPQAPPSLSLTLEGVTAAPLTAYCLDEGGGLWVESARGALALGGAPPLAPEGGARWRAAALPRFVREGGAGARGEVGEVGAPPSRLPCAPRSLSGRERVRLSVGGEEVLLSAEGWRRGAEGRLAPVGVDEIALDLRGGRLLMAAEGGLWAWELEARRPPDPLTLPEALSSQVARRGGVTRLVADGGYWWLARADGLAYPVDLSRSPPLPATLAGRPLRMSPPPTRLSAPLGPHLATLSREGVTLSWGEGSYLVPPTYDIAPLTPQHLALATARGVEVWEMAGERLRLALRLDLGAPATRLVARSASLYILSPTRGLYWARLTLTPAPAPH